MVIFPWYLFSTRSHVDIKNDMVSAIREVASPRYYHRKRIEQMVTERHDGYDAYIKPGSIQVGNDLKNVTLVETALKPRTKIERFLIVIDETWEHIDNPFTGEKSNKLISAHEMQRFNEADGYTKQQLQRYIDNPLGATI